MDMKGIADRQERAAILALNTIFGYLPKVGRTLIDYLDKPSDAFFIDKDEMAKILGKYESHIEKLSPATLKSGEKELEEIEKSGYRFICITDKEYPDMLKECPDAPTGLYIRGKDSPGTIFRKGRPAIAIVGTRDVSRYGSEACEMIVEAMAGCHEKPLIVSGLAIGVDIIAHKAALQYGLPTVAVMATGIDDIYPFRHGHIADMIAESPDSALISDYPRHTNPIAINFLRRNRIIAGLSAATILIESKSKGGGMITARIANSYNREVYALPGKVTDSRSEGCNILIREKAADIITDTESLLNALGLEHNNIAGGNDIISAAEQYYNDSAQADRTAILQLLKTIKKEDSIEREELAHNTGLDYVTASTLTSMLESDGFISIDIMGNCCINRKKM